MGTRLSLKFGFCLLVYGATALQRQPRYFDLVIVSDFGELAAFTTARNVTSPKL
jgi:hypothetical protein